MVSEVFTVFKNVFKYLNFRRFKVVLNDKRQFMELDNSFIVVVIGATGTGKSKLAIEIASQLSGEIINADAMQIYKGLDVITNKVSEEEKLMAKHHLLDIVDPLKTSFNIHDFKSKAIETIQDIVSRKRIPVIVGGTNYYIESLLWNVLIKNESSDDEDDENNSDFEGKSTDELYKNLLKIDSKKAAVVHPNDRRKIMRSLQIYKQNGRPHSHIIEEQQSVEGGSLYGGPLRFKNACILWVQCDKEILEKRLDERVDTMLRNGLIEELHNFHRNYNKQRLQDNTPADYTRGLFQSIGFKEFHDYLMLNDEEREEVKSKKLAEGIEMLKIRTKRYAKKQIKWIKGRFLLYSGREIPPIFNLDATDVSQWNENVLKPALNILSSLQKEETPSIKPLEIEINIRYDKFCRSCDICNKTLLGEMQWIDHVQSRVHKKLTAKVNRKVNKKLEMLEIKSLDSLKQ